MSADLILESAATAFALFFMTSPLTQTIDVWGTPAKVKYVSPVNLLCFYLNCVTQVAYGLWMPVPAVVPCNCYGVAVSVASTAGCWWFARQEEAPNWDRKAAIFTLVAVLASALIVADAALREGGAAQVGFLGMFVSIMLYAAPLTSMQEVIRTKSSETLPVMQSAMGFCNCSCWLAIGLRSGSMPVWCPNVIGVLLTFSQLCLILKYPAVRLDKVIEENVDYIPPLQEHVFADVVRKASFEFAESLTDASTDIGALVRKTSEDFKSYMLSPADRSSSVDYFPLDGIPEKEVPKHGL